MIDPGFGNFAASFTKFSVPDCASYGPLTLDGAVFPGGRSAVTVAQTPRGRTLKVQFTLTSAANATARKVPPKNYQWANYTVEVTLPSPVVGNIKKPTVAPKVKGQAAAKVVGYTIFWQNVPMPVNAPKAYKRKFTFQAKVDPSYTGTLTFDGTAYSDDALAAKTLTVRRAWTSPQCVVEGRRKRCPPSARKVMT